MEDMGVQFMSGQTTAKFTHVTNEVNTINNEIKTIEEICNNLNVSMICGNGMILSVERNEKEDE